MGMIGGGIGAFIGDAHRRASRICNDFELVGGVFDVDYEKNKQFAKKRASVPNAATKVLTSLSKQSQPCLQISGWKLCQ